MDEEESGLSIGDIFRLIFSQKWLALAIAAVITVAGVLALYLGYDNISARYTASFSLTFPRNESDYSLDYYPDNAPFNYRDMVSKENLVKAQESDERFSSVDVKKMYKENVITVTRTAVGDENAEYADYVYTISVKSSYFENGLQAEEFIGYLAELPLRYLKNLSTNQDVFLKSFGDTKFYESKAKALTSQTEYLRSNNAKMFGGAGGMVKVDCQILENKLAEFSSKLNAAIDEMRQNGYVHNVEEVKSLYKSEIAALETEIANKKLELGLLFGRTNGNENVTLEQPFPRVEILASEIAELEKDKNAYNIYIAEEKELTENPGYSQILDNLNNELKTLTDEFEANLDKYFQNYSAVVFDGAVKSEGGLSLVMCVVVSLLAGLVIAAITAFAVAYGKRKRSKVAPAAGSAEPAEPADGQSTDS